MSVLNWLFAPFSSRRRALSLYRRGMVKAKQHDRQGAIQDYTDTIEMDCAPANVRAMALYNRALVYLAVAKIPEALADLKAVLAMPELLEDVKTEARRKLVRVQRRTVEKSSES